MEVEVAAREEGRALVRQSPDDMVKDVTRCPGREVPGHNPKGVVAHPEVSIHGVSWDKFAVTGNGDRRGYYNGNAASRAS